jgi:hypothetical protein
MWENFSLNLNRTRSMVNLNQHEADRNKNKLLTGATAIVSTLLTVVGQPNTPMSAGNGGLSRGLPALPSSDSMRDCKRNKSSTCESK